MIVNRVDVEKFKETVNKGSSSIYCESGYFKWWKMAFF
jgi:hypothetical protein